MTPNKDVEGEERERWSKQKRGGGGWGGVGWGAVMLYIVVGIDDVGVLTR